MKLRDYVLGQIQHHDTPKVPFTLGFEGDVAERIDQHYGDKGWRIACRNTWSTLTRSIPT